MAGIPLSERKGAPMDTLIDFTADTTRSAAGLWFGIGDWTLGPPSQTPPAAALRDTSDAAVGSFGAFTRTVGFSSFFAFSAVF